MTRVERIALRIAVFAAGALLMSLEIAAFRIIGKTFGSALRETTTVISVFLAAMSVGYWAGGRAADRWPDSRTLVASLFSAAGILLLVPWVDAFLSPRIAGSDLPLFVHAFLATTVLFAAPTLLLASTSPIAIRLFTTSTGESGSTAGAISAISTVGSIFGSILTAFYLIDLLESVARTVLFVAMCTSATGMMVVLCVAQRPLASRVRRFGVAFVSAVVLVFLTTAFFRSSTLDNKLLAPLPGTKTLFVGDSPYHRVTVRERGGFREMVFNFAIQTRMRVSDPSGPGLEYSDAVHLGPLMRPQIRRILLIGLGGGTLPKQFLRYYPEATIDVVEIDPLVVKVAHDWFAVPKDPRLRIHVADGRLFLERSTEEWDLIILDAYTTTRYGDTIPPHLTTREFFEETAEHLTENGILHFHCASPESRLVPALHRTLRGVYSHVGRMNGELLASRAPLETRQEILLASAKDFAPSALPRFADSIRAFAVTAPADGPVLTDDYAPVDTLLRQEQP